jgi:hypothetical protein
MAQNLANAYQGMLSIAGVNTTFGTLGVPYAPNDNAGTAGYTQTFDVAAGTQYTAAAGNYGPGSSGVPALSGVFSRGVDASSAAFGGTRANVLSYYNNQRAGFGNAAAANESATQQLLSNLQSSIAANTTAVNSNTTSTSSNTSATTANTEALSPYYSQDPRTSHIGFRSQGMASGGYVDVPGSPSANDNMIATIPVASGERIYVDPMSSKRGSGSGGSTNITINVPVTIVGNMANDQNAIGRTVYQATQTAARQLKAVS